MPTCPLGTLALHVNFPDCWDGVNLDSPDHKSHMAYAGKGKTCPPTHPILLPRIRVNVRYPTTGGPTAVLASGGQFSGHADFFNVWVPSELRGSSRAASTPASPATPRLDSEDLRRPNIRVASGLAADGGSAGVRYL